MELLNQPVDISSDFTKIENEYYVAGAVTSFDTVKNAGTIQWNFHRWTLDWFFNKIDKHLQKLPQRDAPWQDYEHHPICKFDLSFTSERTVRIRIKTTSVPQREYESLILDGEPAVSDAWKLSDSKDAAQYISTFGSVVLNKKTWKLDIYDNAGQPLVGTQSAESFDSMHSKKMPFLFIRRSSDYTRSIAASFTLFPGEKIVGGGESFTQLDKRGQKLVLMANDTQSAATPQMYKPVPFFISNRGYGFFINTTSPVTADIGNTYDGCNTLYTGDDQLDIFFFIGSPKEILSEYTTLTGKSPLPPLWSFGLWMSRFSYRSDIEVKSIAEKLRYHQVPCDVIHIDAGWFKKGINCDFCFNPETFPEPKKMISELRENGFRVSLWQIPYFTPLNPIFDEVVSKGLFVKDHNGNLSGEDAILDFSNEETKKWYGEKITALLKMGVSAIKADFGEAAPFHGHYASGRTGFYEHNAYALRYTGLVHSITKEVNGENIIWARSAWAGGQRNPVHWGGDAEVSDIGMAGTLRAGLSLGLSGFSFWSHDIGGFPTVPNEELFKRWSLFGLFTSHSRVHGFPPREPWEFSQDFLEIFRKLTEMKYRLMPYIYAQAALCARNGWPFLKALLFNYPDDPGCWFIEDEYLFGDDILVAPIMETNRKSRRVYLPEGKWIDYLSAKEYSGLTWHEIQAAEIPGILLVRSGSVIPHIDLAQSTDLLDWNSVEFKVYAEPGQTATGTYCTPDGGELFSLEAKNNDGNWKIVTDNVKM